MLNVGLTGGIGSGKSSVARRLAEHGAVVVDSDVIAREVVAPGTDGLREIVEAFGAGVLHPDGSLDRPALGALVFGDTAARRRLEEITHPRVRARSRELAAAAAPDAVLVNDVPLLVEGGLAPTYHLVVVVETDRDIRIGRLVRDRGMTERQALDRIAAQADDARRRAAADIVLRNDGDLADLHVVVDRLWRRLVPYEANVRHRRRAPRPADVTLAEPDPSWPDQARRLADRIRHLVGDPDRRIDHVGSTAVPGLAAKDVVDLQLSVSSLAEADSLADRLADGGFPRPPGDWYDSPKPPDLDPARWTKRLHLNADPGRPVNLHVRVTGSPGWRCALLLRDLLRADEATRAEYLALKQGLAERSATVDEYAEAKEPWFDVAYDRARRWADRTGWQP
ncbi:dephospho-CoA kinase [Polymorphospora sp. NPDC051019]|uniref:dephospho-CoA kinase n=1 Tax=Polymorphospora sp. NPDC051019 TaxID=3155725 RepID=UPI00342E892D